ncbi:Protein transport protein sft2 [Cucumispora dikerogammari]|nr:Protein transport protein sft2 [Cucumispora dikerogammari]
MNFDSIKELIKNNSANEQIPRHKLFKEASFLKKLINLDSFTLTRSQRIMCTIISGIAGFLSLVLSISKFFLILFSPSAFLVPYIFSNLSFFLMIGFVCGFDHYLRNLLQYQRRRYTLFFFSSTSCTILIICILKSYFLSMLSVVIQIVSFGCFCFTFVPFGCQTLNGFVYSTFGF